MLRIATNDGNLWFREPIFQTKTSQQARKNVIGDLIGIQLGTGDSACPYYITWSKTKCNSETGIKKGFQEASATM